MTIQGIAVINSPTHVAAKSLVLPVLLKAGLRGCTTSEIETRLGLDHGTVSGALSGLDEDGKVSMLTEKRSRQSVYVLVGNINGRPLRPRAPQKHNAEQAHLAAIDNALAVIVGYRGAPVDLEALLTDVQRLRTP